MRVAVFGASGRTGRHVVEQALDRGDEVVAIVRDPSRAQLPPGAEVATADLLAPDGLAAVLRGADLVVSAVGPTDGRAPTTVYSAGVAAIVAAMRQAGVRRLVVISAVPVSRPEENSFFVGRVVNPILWRFFGHSYRDLRVMEAELQRVADIDWTVVRPPRLIDSERSRAVRSAVDRPLAAPSSISRRDLAAELLRVGEDASTVRSVVTASW